MLKYIGVLILKQSKYARYVLGVFVALTITFSLLWSSYARTMVQEQEPIIFLVNAELIPIAYEENGIAKGVVVDIAKAVGEKIARPIEIIAMDWPEAQTQVLAGQADALLQINQTPERERIFSFSNPLLQSEFVIFRRQADPDIQRITDLEGKRVGLQPGSFMHELLRSDGHIELVLISNSVQSLAELKSGALDALVLDRWVGEYALAQSGISEIRVSREPLDTSSSHIAVRKGNVELLELINYGLQEINNDGTLIKILDDWRGKNVIYITEERVIRIVGFMVMGILLTISAISVFFVVRLKKLNKALEVNVVDRTRELAMVNERLKSANAELKKQSMLDQLTHIPNRRGFDGFLEQAWEDCQRLQQPLALIVIDLDRFKEVNDLHGHLMGDQYLKELAGILQDITNDFVMSVARFGGDEFVAVMSNTTEARAFQVAEVIRERLEELTITSEGNVTGLSASFGVAALTPDQDLSSSELISLADQALYKAKTSGRNTVKAKSHLKRQLKK